MLKVFFVRVMVFVCPFLFLMSPAFSFFKITYSLEELGSSRWKATYQVYNQGETVDLEWFSVYFEYGFYDGLTIETPSPLSEQWDQKAWDPFLIDTLPFSGIYDAATTLSAIKPGDSVSGFSISFDWLGETPPTGGQPIEIYGVYPDEPLKAWSGRTIYIPEPTTLLLLTSGVMLTNCKHYRRR